MSAVSAGVTYRVVVAGAELRMLVLATEPGGSVGVDLDTGAFVRASHPPLLEPPQPFDVISGEIAGAVEPPDMFRPEALELAGTPECVGHISARRSERLLSALRHPPQLPLLGLKAIAVPYWTLTGESPSLAIVEPRGEPRVRLTALGPECVFSWNATPHELPMVDQHLVGRLRELGISRPSKGHVQRILGYKPRRLLVMLTKPHDGYCHKAVAALLPSGR